ncbi:IS1 transposase [Bacteroidales bacterium Barb6XT]|nr:IS1 transposase [Bacteroidales bacterium Barb6XT]
MKKQALRLYLESFGFRSIGRFLNVSHATVYERIRSFGLQDKMLQSEAKETETVEMDEMRINQKNYCRIRIAVGRLGKRFLNFIVGDRSTETGKKLQEKINGFEMNVTAKGYWKSYDHFIPEEKHVGTKAETFTVEGRNSLFRYFLARMRRKSKCGIVNLI